MAFRQSLGCGVAVLLVNQVRSRFENVEIQLSANILPHPRLDSLRKDSKCLALRTGRDVPVNNNRYCDLRCPGHIWLLHYLWPVLLESLRIATPYSAGIDDSCRPRWHILLRSLLPSFPNGLMYRSQCHLDWDGYICALPTMDQHSKGLLYSHHVSPEPLWQPLASIT